MDRGAGVVHDVRRSPKKIIPLARRMYARLRFVPARAARAGRAVLSRLLIENFRTPAATQRSSVCPSSVGVAGWAGRRSPCAGGGGRDRGGRRFAGSFLGIFPRESARRWGDVVVDSDEIAGRDAKASVARGRGRATARARTVPPPPHPTPDSPTLPAYAAARPLAWPQESRARRRD